MPERSSSAGDSSEPHATTTWGALTLTDAERPLSGSAHRRLHAGGAAAVAITRSARQRVHEHGAVVLRVLQVGLGGRALGAALVAEADVAGGLE